MTAPAPTEIAMRLKARGELRTDAQRQRVLRAAIEWVYDQRCPNALAELEDAVTDLMGFDLDGTPRQ